MQNFMVGVGAGLLLMGMLFAGFSPQASTGQLIAGAILLAAAHVKGK